MTDHRTRLAAKRERGAFDYMDERAYRAGHAALEEVVLKLVGAIGSVEASLEDGGAYIVEDGFEEPWLCKHLRQLSNALAEFESYLAEGEK